MKHEKFYDHLIDKVEHLNHEDNKYHPHRSLKHHKVVSNVLTPNWKDTNVTPPLRKFNNGAVPLHLDASLCIQIQTDEKLKVIYSSFKIIQLAVN